MTMWDRLTCQHGSPVWDCGTCWDSAPVLDMRLPLQRKMDEANDRIAKLEAKIRRLKRHSRPTTRATRATRA